MRQRLLLTLLSLLAARLLTLTAIASRMMRGQQALIHGHAVAIQQAARLLHQGQRLYGALARQGPRQAALQPLCSPLDLGQKECASL